MISAKIQLKTDTIENWTVNQNAMLLNGEAAVVQFPDGTSKLKIGDGKTVFKDLPYASGQIPEQFKASISEDGGKTFLSTNEFLFVNIAEKEFNQKVIDGTLLSNAIYEVSSDYLNLYDEQVKNIADPTDDQDAVTKKYVDSEIAKIDVSEQLAGYALKDNVNVKYDSTTKKITLNADGHVSEIDATAFVKDGMVNSVTYNHASKKIVMTFNTEAGKTPISVDVASLVDTYTAGNGLTVVNNQFKINENIVATKTNLNQLSATLNDKITNKVTFRYWSEV